MPVARHGPVVEQRDHFWTSPDKASALLYHGDVRDCLRKLKARSVHCVVTSPPYWGLRDYGVCVCATFLSSYDSPTSTLSGGGNVGKKQADPNCSKCGGTGRNISKSEQIGAEPIPDCGTHGMAQCGQCFVCSMVSVFREVYRVLRDDGTLWLNLGDTYSQGSQLTGIPWRVTFALQNDGWILRQDIVWAKPNPMPESVESRCTKSHEYIFLLAKSSKYYFDNVAIEEESSSGTWNPKATFGTPKPKALLMSPEQREMQRTAFADNTHHDDVEKSGRNKRSVWFVPTRAYKGAHFATFSPQLITPCVLAGTSEHGCCAMCGRPYERVVVKVGNSAGLTGGEYDLPGQSPHSNARDDSRDRSFDWSRNGNEGSGSTLDTVIPNKETIGWQKLCGCQTSDIIPCTVLDLFVGSGTTVATALELGRHGVGIDISDTYLLENAIPRIQDSLGKVCSRTSVIMPMVNYGNRCGTTKLRGT